MRQSTKYFLEFGTAVLEHILILLSLHKSVFRQRYDMNDSRICQNLCYGVEIFYNIWYNSIRYFRLVISYKEFTLRPIIA